MMMMRFSGRLGLLVATIVMASAAPWLSASERAFTYVYETTTMAPGTFEYEQWVTWSTHKGEDSEFDRIDFRHELEFGVTDRFQAAIYLSDWRYEDGDSVEHDGAHWRDVAFEGIYALTDPVTDPLGVALYGEVKGGEEFLEFEGKLLLQKNLGPVIVAWNGIIEAEWEGDGLHEDNGELGQTFGVSYEVHPRFTVGGEVVHEVEYEDWAEWGDHVVYVGPNATYRAGRWWVGVTPLFQVTDVDGEADFQTRFLLGIDF